MSVVLESAMLRTFLHRLADRLVDELESKATSPARPPAPRPGPRADTSRPRITLADKAETPDRARPEPRPPSKAGEVTVSCRRDCGRLAIAVALSAEVAGRLGLKPHGKAVGVLQGGKLRVRGSKAGRMVYRVHADSDRLFLSTPAAEFGIGEKHAAEDCAFHFDAEDALLVESPAWLKAAARPAPAKPLREGPKAGPPVSCKKMAGTNPAIKCHACKEAPATVQCSLCPTLLCNACWEPHVRKHWHTAITSRAPTGRAAAAGK